MIQRIFILIVFLLLMGSQRTLQAQDSLDHKIAPGIFSPAWSSLEEKYQCPEWFRDAKFGIWAHMSAQCVPEQGDWYARQMYIQGSSQYNYHVAHYGHPTQFGFMEIEHLWKVEHWDPERLMTLYKRAGAKYFVALANHHDNFDNYDSKYHAWNSVRVGPMKDIIGTWEKVARKNGLYFGVSNHSAHAWHWFQTAYGYDGEGKYAGKRYDAATLTKADGKGKWWEGLDPQELYAGESIKLPDGFTSAKAIEKWHVENTLPWSEDPPASNPGFTKSWYLRCQDLVDSYHPDLVYFDDYGLPLGQTGLDIVAHYYNASMKWNKGALQTVVTAKRLKPGQNAGVVEDYERGYVGDVLSYPWQTCTCIGDWHYNRIRFLNNSYKTVQEIVHQLIDIVSKNGNLLLSIPIRGDGTIDSLEEEFLNGMAGWMDVNGVAIFGTRPWKIYGEGPTKVVGGMFNEGDVHFTESDVRFTTKGDTLYALVLGEPAGKVVAIKSLGQTAAQVGGRKIVGVSLLGSDAKLAWTQTGEDLSVTMPAKLPCKHAIALCITGIVGR